jgi:hypothetical protein
MGLDMTVHDKVVAFVAGTEALLTYAPPLLTYAPPLLPPLAALRLHLQFSLSEN